MTTRILFLVLLFVALGQTGYSQQWTWGLKASGSMQDATDQSDIAVDSRGAIVIAGNFQQHISFGHLSLHTDDDYYSDIFLCRIGADREVQWLKRIEAGHNYGDDNGLSLDDDGNIYLTGTIDGYIFASKYDSTGTLIWHNNFGKEHYGYGSAISTDQFDNVYVTGGSGWEFFMAKLSYSGETLWVKDIWVNSSAGCNVTDLAVDAVGNIYFAGSFGINILPLDHITLKGDGYWAEDAFWGKMDTHGNFLWAKSATGPSRQHLEITLTSDNHFYLAGTTSTGISFDNFYISGTCCSGSRPFIVKSDTDGKLMWAKNAFTNYSGGITKDIEIDYAGNLYLTGAFFTCYGSGCTESDFYIEKYNSEGQNLWRQEFAMGDGDYCKAVDIDNHGSLYALGLNASSTFIDEGSWTPLPTTYGVGKMATGASTYKKTPRPSAERLTSICAGETDLHSLALTAQGESVTWYSDPLLSHKLHHGNEYKPGIVETDTFYVTQTRNGIESWPKEVVLHISNIPDGHLIVKDSIISAPDDEHVQYQWLYNGEVIAGATESHIRVDTTVEYQSFSVILSDGTCQKTLDNVITSLESAIGPSAVMCYPNPTSTLTTIKVSDDNAVVRMYVTNIIGEVVTTLEPPVKGEQAINLTDFKPGVYMVHVIGKRRRESVKVIRQ